MAGAPGYNEVMGRRNGSQARTRVATLRAAPERSKVVIPPSRSELALRAHALDTFGSAMKMNHWFNRPNQVFQGRTPLEMMASDPRAVEVELTRIDHGVYI